MSEANGQHEDCSVGRWADGDVTDRMDEIVSVFNFQLRIGGGKV